MKTRTLMALMLLLFTAFAHGQIWEKQSRVIGAGHQRTNVFGISIAASEQYCAISGRFEKDSTTGRPEYSDKIQVFKRTMHNQWEYEFGIPAPENSAEGGYPFGYKLAMTDSILAIAAPGDAFDENGENRFYTAGAVYIYELDPTGKWSFRQKITAPNRTEVGVFGISVAAIDQQILVGAVGTYSVVPNSGAVFAYQKDVSGSWTMRQQITTQAPLDSNDRFGGQIACNDQYLLISALGDDGDGTAALDLKTGIGAVYLYEWKNNNWEENRRLLSPSPKASENSGFGLSIDVEGNTVVIHSSSTSVDRINHVFDLSDSSTFSKPLVVELDSIKRLGHTSNFVLNQGTIAIPSSQSDKMFFYNKDVQGNWSLSQTIPLSGVQHSLGYSMAATSNEILVGSPYEQTTWFYAGAVHSFLLCSPQDTLVHVDRGTATANDTTSLQYYWIDCRNQNRRVEGENSYSFTPRYASSFAMVITNSLCTDTSDCRVIYPQSMHENHASTSILLYPNPATGNDVRYLNSAHELVSIEALDINGKSLFRLQGSFQGQTALPAIQTPGSYVLRTISKNGEKSRLKLLVL